MSEHESNQKFFNPGSRDAVIGDLHARLSNVEANVMSVTKRIETVEDMFVETGKADVARDAKITDHATDIQYLHEKDANHTLELVGIQAWMKALVAVGSALLFVLGLIGWLLSNDYLSIHTPRTELHGSVSPRDVSLSR